MILNDNNNELFSFVIQFIGYTGIIILAILVIFAAIRIAQGKSKSIDIIDNIFNK